MTSTPQGIAQLSKAQQLMLLDPVCFGETVLGMRYYPWQKEVLRALAKPYDKPVVLRTCNESGKTSKVVTTAVLWHGGLFPKGRTVSTAGAWRQVKSQLVPHLRRFAPRFPQWKFTGEKIEDRHGIPRYEGFSTNDAGKFEGFHGNDDHPRSELEPLMIIVDEAKSVDDAIFQAIDRCKPQRLLICSSPGAAEGEFYHAFGKRRGSYRTFKATYRDCPHWKEADAQKLRDKWGAEHPLVLSLTEAEFMPAVADAILALKEIEGCLEFPPDWNRADERHAYCDFAAGGDENVLALREGNRVRIVEAWRETNTMSAVGRFITLFAREGLAAHEIEGDAGGLGLPMIHAIREAGWPILAHHGGEAPRFDEHYKNATSEMWHEGAKRVRNRTILLPEGDDDLVGQMMSRKQKYDSKGKLWIETKDEMKKRGLPSPDRADAVFGAMMPLPCSIGNLIETQYPESWREEEEERHGTQHHTLAGIDAGY